MWRAWIPFLAFNERVGLWRTALRVRPRSCRTRLEYAATRLALFGYALGILACAFEPVVLRWIGAYLPALGLSLVCEELINLPHHIEAATTTRKLPLWEQTRVTHSCSSVPVWSSALLLHFNLHAAHHLFPSLPWYRLPDAQRALSAHVELAVLENELRVSVRLRRAPFAQVFAAYLSARPDDSE